MYRDIIYKIVRILGILAAIAIITLGILYFSHIANYTRILPFLLAILLLSMSVNRLLKKGN